MSAPGRGVSRLVTRAMRRHLVGRDQRWRFEPPPSGWTPPPVDRTALYLHVPFCRHACPYCPYTKVPYAQQQVEPFGRAALSEVDLWADAVGRPEISSVYIGGGTPTLALDAVEAVVGRVRQRFRLAGDICIETNPSDVDRERVARLRAIGVSLVSLGVQSFSARSLSTIGRRYDRRTAERALELLAGGGFASVNADLMFALPGQSVDDIVGDLERAAELGATQITAYPLFTFPYSAVGEHLRLTGIRLPDLGVRRAQYSAIASWCERHAFQRVSVWGFARRSTPRYSSVTRDGYLGIGPGAGSHLPDGFVLNTFDLPTWEATVASGRLPVALRMPFAGEMSGWWWLYWRVYDTRIPMARLDEILRGDAGKARRWLAAIRAVGLARQRNGWLELTRAGAFWLHLAQNHFALSYVNTLWKAGRLQPWPPAVTV